jgi:hypothetical protein
MEGSLSATGPAVAFCLRPEALRVIAPGDVVPAGWTSLEARLVRVEFLGALTRLETRIAEGATLRVALLDQPLNALSPGCVLTLAYDPRRTTPFKTS